MSSNGRWIRAERRLAIYLRDDFTCVYCECDLAAEGPRGITLEHVVPRSRGGSNRDDNLVTSCLSCNSARQDKRLVRAVWLRVRRAARSAKTELRLVRLEIAAVGGIARAHETLRLARRRRAA